jgi:hypothetical protein
MSTDTKHRQKISFHFSLCPISRKEEEEEERRKRQNAHYCERAFHFSKRLALRGVKVALW